MQEKVRRAELPIVEVRGEDIVADGLTNDVDRSKLEKYRKECGFTFVFLFCRHGMCVNFLPGDRLRSSSAAAADLGAARRRRRSGAAACAAAGSARLAVTRLSGRPRLRARVCRAPRASTSGFELGSSLDSDWI